jgi:hypothetical protein
VLVLPVVAVARATYATFRIRPTEAGSAAGGAGGSGCRGLLVRCPVAALVFEPCAEVQSRVG